MELKSPKPAPASPDPQVPLEQRLYARVLNAGMKLGLASLCFLFLVYLLGLRPPHVPIDRLPDWWGLSCKDFVRQTKIATGFGWVRELVHGDYANLVGIVLLSGISLVSYLTVLPVFLRKRDWAFAAIAIVEVLLLLLAASGLLNVGGH